MNYIDSFEESFGGISVTAAVPEVEDTPAGVLRMSDPSALFTRLKGRANGEQANLLVAVLQRLNLIPQDVKGSGQWKNVLHLVGELTGQQSSLGEDCISN